MSLAHPNSFRNGPDERGHFGLFGGRFVAETLMPLILELEKAYAAAKVDPEFKREMEGYLAHYVGRPSPLYFAERLTEHLRDVAAASGGAAPVTIRYATGGGIGPNEMETIIFLDHLKQNVLPNYGKAYTLDMTFTRGTPEAATLQIGRAHV